MSANSEGTSSALNRSNSQVFEDIFQLLDLSTRTAVCALCQKALSPDIEITNDLAPIGVCGDCKFLLLEDFGTHSQRMHRGRFRYSSSGSTEDGLSHQLPSLANSVRQNQSFPSLADDQLVDSDTPSWLLQPASSHTTPNESRRWRRVFSDTDSDGFDNWGSLYGDNESNASVRRYGVPNGETDSFSFSAYGGDSEISMDRYSFVGTGILNLPDEGDEFDSDTDIDPMHAGLSHWNFDDMEEEEEEEEGDGEGGGEWEVAEEAEASARLQIYFTSTPGERSDPINWGPQIHFSEPEEILSRRVTDTWQTYTDRNSNHLDEARSPPYIANFGDYLDTREFEDLLEHLAENDSARRGAPPAAVSFVHSLPRIIIGKEHEKHDELVCAICKDPLAIGTEVNQLPCSHLYHTCCILPWLSARNSCPLCRYELPTDDKDYEEGKHNIDIRNEFHEVQQQLDVMDGNSSDGAEANEEDGISQGGVQQSELVSMVTVDNPSAVTGSRGRWFFLAAAPIVSLVGIVIVLWLGNPLVEGRRQLGCHNLQVQNQHQVHVSTSANHREGRSRRWWCFF